ncbi:MAG TPA: PilZ domain-containing protein [Polyangiaceae bacterium]|nr:PilZ domain-containing protein [Polyangiaceae bacterium]
MHDKRSHPRVPLSANVTCELAGGGTITGRVRDISIGGMFIETEAPGTFGTELTIVLRLPNTKADARLPGTIRWLNPGGFGVQFGLLGARETHAISELFKS